MSGPYTVVVTHARYESSVQVPTLEDAIKVRGHHESQHRTARIYGPCADPEWNGLTREEYERTELEQ